MEILKATLGFLEATFVVFGEGVVMGRQVASGLQVRSGAGADANTWEAMELKMTAGVEMETAGATGKSKETADSEAETMVGTEGGVDTDAGMDSESRVGWSGVVAGAEASTRCTIASGGGDAGADLRSTVAGTATGDDAVSVAKVRIGPIAETMPLACAAANARLGIAGAETEWVV